MLLLGLMACEHRPERPLSSIEVQGHRGARGLWPENTLQGFLDTAALGVDTLEFDCVLSAENEVMVHHDLYFNPELTRRDGRWLSAASKPLREQSVKEIQQVDVGQIHPGTEYATRFATQKSRPSRIPTLREVLRETKTRWPNLRYNIELKVDPLDSRGSSDPRALAAAVINVVREAGLENRVTLQSFVFEALRISAQLAPEIERACLTEETPAHKDKIQRRGGISPWTNRDIRSFGGSVPRLVKDTGCGIWSPKYQDLTQEKLREAHRLGLRVVVWTVNASTDIDGAIALGVDGIISDYPDRVLAKLSKNTRPFQK